MVAFFSDHFGDGINVAATDKALDTQFRSPPGLGHGRRRTKVARATVVDLLAVVPDVLRMATFNSNARPHSLILHHGAAGAGALVDVGLYLTGIRHAGAVVDANLFASAVDTALVSSVTAGVDVLYEAALTLLASSGQTLWEMLGLAADPQVQYDLAITGNVDSVNAITYCMEMEYTSGD